MKQSFCKSGSPVLRQTLLRGHAGCENFKPLPVYMFYPSTTLVESHRTLALSSNPIKYCAVQPINSGEDGASIQQDWWRAREEKHGTEELHCGRGQGTWPQMNCISVSLPLAPCCRDRPPRSLEVSALNRVPAELLHGHSLGLFLPSVDEAT